MDDLNAASLEDVHEWFKTYYGPSNAVVAIAGDIEVNLQPGTTLNPADTGPGLDFPDYPSSDVTAHVLIEYSVN